MQKETTADATIEKMVSEIIEQIENDKKSIMRGIANMKWHLYLRPDGKVYYNQRPYGSDDELIIYKVDPDVVWNFDFNREALIKFYSRVRGWLLLDPKNRN